MKKLFTLLSFLACISFSSHSQWSLQTNPLGTTDGNSLGKIQFVSQTEGWIACGSNGSLLHTTNSGTTWEIVTPFTADNVGNMSDPGLSLSFVNPSHGWALKTYGIAGGEDFSTANGAVLYQTTTSGSTWTKKNFPKLFETTTYGTSDLQGAWQWHSIVAANTSLMSTWGGWMHGLITLDATGNGTFSSIVKSDGNNNNTSTSVSMTISSQGKVSVGSSSHGFMSVDKKSVYITMTDGGGGFMIGIMEKTNSATTYNTADMQGTWQIHSLTTANNSFASPNANWMHGTITIDANGNATANLIDRNGPKSPRNSVLAISSDGIVSSSPGDLHGFMGIDKKSITISMTDGSGSGFNLMLMQKINPATTYSLPDLQGIWQTHILSTVNPTIPMLNQQSSWTHGTITMNANGTGNMHFTDSNGKNESNEVSLQLSTDGILTITGGDLHGTLSADKNSIVLTKSEQDGTLTMVLMQKDLSASGDFGMQVQFATENIGWVSTYNMLYSDFKIYKTTNGGTDWNEITGPANPVGGFYHFVDATNGWLIGANHVTEGGVNSIFHTIDGGLSWTLQAENVGDANAIFFSDLSHGWVVGKSGLVLKTTNGGANWTAVTNTGQSSNSNSKAVFFTDANNGWIGSGLENTEGVGTRFILATKDGGATWTTQQTPVTNSIFSISFWDANHGWFTSDYGQIAHFVQSTVNISAGGLATAFSPTDMSSIAYLTLTGTIDARDFKTMRDNMPMLTNIDLSGVTILAYSGTEGTYNTTLTDYPANTIPRSAFNTSTGKSTLQSIILPGTLTAIGRAAFNKCSGLKSINIPSSVTSIGYGAFNLCSGLSSVNIPSSVTYIDTWTFGSCKSLKSISIPSSVTSIGYAAFTYSGLENITLPAGLQTIGQYAFQNCSSLSSVSIPSTVTSIGYCAFTFDNALTKLEVAGDNANFSSVNGVLFNKTQQKLLCYPGGSNSVYQIPTGVTVVDTAAFEGSWVIRNVSIPTTVTTLSPEAFYYCTNLKSIDIPASVTSIGSYAFYNCYGLTSITMHSTPINLNASDSVFNYVDKSACTLYVPVGTKAAYQTAAQWKDFNNIVELVYKTVNVSAGGLYTALTATELSNTTNLKITGTIDARDFKTMRDNMPLLSDLDLSGVIIQAYAGTVGPNDGYTAYSANAIPNHAFYVQATNTGKKSLRNVLLPPTITTIEQVAFTASSLGRLVLPNGVTSVQDWAFASCNLSIVSIPATLSSIGLCAFTYNWALAGFNVAADNPYMTTIDGILFDKSQKTIICYPNGARSNNYQIPTGVSTIDKSAFAGWSLESVFIPSSVNTISKYAFYQCESLKSIEIPASVIFIGESAFAGCTGLTSIKVDANYPLDISSSNNVFLNVNKSTCTLYVPIGSKSMYQSANQWKDFVNIVEAENNTTYNVTVPPATKACYIAGEMNNWSFTPMTMVDNTHYTITIPGANPATHYKYCSGPAWKYVEKAADGSELPNRAYTPNDVVASWASVYDPTMVLTDMVYSVTVPDGTKACYIAGEMNDWNLVPMNKVDNTHYTVTLKSSDTFAYKFCSGPAWDFVEVNADGSSDSNRNYATNDIVVRWSSVYDPGALTGADYYLPLNVGNYLKLNTTEIPNGSKWGPRMTIYHINRTENIGNVPYFVEQGTEIMNDNPANSSIFRTFWLRKDAIGNIVAGAYATTGSTSLDSATIFKTPALIFPNQFLTVGYSQTYQEGPGIVGLDSVISTTAAAASFTNCIQIRSIRKTNGVIDMVEDNYYAYHVGLVMSKRLLPTQQMYTATLLDYLAIPPTAVINPKLSDYPMAIYPNPATDGFYIALDGNNARISIYNLNGMLVISTNVVDKKLINISALNRGMYIVKIATESNTYERKLMKK
ncbi:MAG: leucine-rich repeat protein [Paludibacter sp.]|nr:leucine-rich repeat protein [Paludibacter sp.]